jgi:hypothetical protein
MNSAVRHRGSQSCQSIESQSRRKRSWQCPESEWQALPIYLPSDVHAAACYGGQQEDLKISEARQRRNPDQDMISPGTMPRSFSVVPATNECYMQRPSSHDPRLNPRDQGGPTVGAASETAKSDCMPHAQVSIRSFVKRILVKTTTGAHQIDLCHGFWDPFSRPQLQSRSLPCETLVSGGQ